MKGNERCHPCKTNPTRSLFYSIEPRNKCAAIATAAASHKIEIVGPVPVQQINFKEVEKLNHTKKADEIIKGERK
jgi:hypothetical protein